MPDTPLGRLAAAIHTAERAGDLHKAARLTEVFLEHFDCEPPRAEPGTGDHDHHFDPLRGRTDPPGEYA